MPEARAIAAATWAHERTVRTEVDDRSLDVRPAFLHVTPTPSEDAPRRRSCRRAHERPEALRFAPSAPSATLRKPVRSRGKRPHSLCTIGIRAIVVTAAI